MRRIVLGLMVIALGAVPLTAVAAGQKSRHFTNHLLGALVQTRGSSSTYVYEVSSKQFGPGAGVLVSKSTSATTGTSRGVIYFASGSLRSVTTYRIAAEPNGVLRLTSTGEPFVTDSGNRILLGGPWQRGGSAKSSMPAFDLPFPGSELIQPFAQRGHFLVDFAQLRFLLPRA